MKKLSIIFVNFMLVCMLLLTACESGESTGSTAVVGTDGYYTIETETEAAFTASANSGLTLLGVQFYQGNPIQLCVDVKREEGQELRMDIYACQTDGSRELVAGNVSGEYQRHNLFLGADGSCLAWSGQEVLKISSEGEALCHTHADGTIRDICQLADGSTYLLVRDEEKEKLWLETLDISTGEIQENKKLCLGEMGEYLQYLSDGETDVYLLNSKGISRINMADGSLSEALSFQGTTYKLGTVGMCAFRMTGESEAEILRGSALEKIAGRDVSEEKTVLVFATMFEVGGDDNKSTIAKLLNACIEGFNQSQDKYFVVSESRGDGALADYKNRVSIQLATGGGPDILYSGVVEEPASLIEKGLFLDLSSYMEQSGVDEADYFPCTFSWYREENKIYGINMFVQPKEIWISEEFLGSREIPTIEELVDKLLVYDKQAVFHAYWDSRRILEYFLCGSENLWGMVDWNAGTCDFKGELFAKMLEVAKKYNYDASKADYPTLVGDRINAGFYDYESYEQLEREGKVAVGYLFDDGAHITNYESTSVVINANSKCPEGAWEFVHFLMTEGQYLYPRWVSTEYPMYKEALDTLARKEMGEGAYIKRVDATGQVTRVTWKAGKDAFDALGKDVEAYKALYDLKQETVDEIKSTLEDVRFLPTETRPILEIVYEEAAAYFAGSKTMEEVIPIIENRVGLYLEENHQNCT